MLHTFIGVLAGMAMMWAVQNVNPGPSSAIPNGPLVPYAFVASVALLLIILLWFPPNPIKNWRNR